MTFQSYFGVEPKRVFWSLQHRNSLHPFQGALDYSFPLNVYPILKRSTHGVEISHAEVWERSSGDRQRIDINVSWRPTSASHFVNSLANLGTRFERASNTKQKLLQWRTFVRDEKRYKMLIHNINKSSTLNTDSQLGSSNLARIALRHDNGL